MVWDFCRVFRCELQALGLGQFSVPVFVLLTIVRLVLAGSTGPFCARGSIRPLELAGSCVINQGIVTQILLYAKANE